MKISRTMKVGLAILLGAGFVFNSGLIRAEDADDVFGELEGEAEPKKAPAPAKKAEADDVFGELEGGDTAETKSDKTDGAAADDVFSELGGDTKTVEEPKERMTFIKDLWKNKKITSIVRGSGYFSSPRDRQVQQTESVLGSVRLNVETQANLRGKDLIFFEGWAERGNEDDTYHQHHDLDSRDLSNKRNYFHLNQLYYTFSFDKSDLTFGKKVLELGTSDIYSPVNRFNHADMNDPSNVREEGQWMIEDIFYIKDFQWRNCFLPVFMPSRLPSKHSRWSMGSGGGDAFNANYMQGDYKSDIPNPNPENWQFLTELKTTWKGWDLFLGAFHGFNQIAMIRTKKPMTTAQEKKLRDDLKAGTFSAGLNDPQLVRTHIKVFDAFTGFAVTHKNWEFHGEAIWQLPYHSCDDQYLNWVLGTTYTNENFAMKMHMQKIEWTLEYAREHILDHKDNDLFINSSLGARTGQDTLMTKVRFEVNNKLDLYLAGTREFSMHNRSTTWSAGFKKKFNDHWKLSSWFECYNASSDSSVNNWRSNDRVVTELEFTF